MRVCGFATRGWALWVGLLSLPIEGEILVNSRMQCRNDSGIACATVLHIHFIDDWLNQKSMRADNLTERPASG